MSMLDLPVGIVIGGVAVFGAVWSLEPSLQASIDAAKLVLCQMETELQKLDYEEGKILVGLNSSGVSQKDLAKKLEELKVQYRVCNAAYIDCQLELKSNCPRVWSFLNPKSPGAKLSTAIKDLRTRVSDLQSDVLTTSRALNPSPKVSKKT